MPRWRCLPRRVFSATRLDDVAKRAGISKGTLYLYFDSKQALFQAVVETLIGPQLKQIEKLVDEFEGSNQALLRQLIQGWWRNVGETNISAIPKLIVSEAGNFPELARFFVTNVVSRMRTIFEGIISNGVASGEFKSCDIKHVARALMSPMVLAAIWERSLKHFDSEEYDTQAYLNVQVDVMINGMRKAGV